MKRDRDYADLDALVLAEIESMRPGRIRRASAKRKSSACGSHKPETINTQERQTAAPLARIYGEDRAAEGITGEEAEALFDSSIEEQGDIFDEDAAGTSQLLFSTEEQAFMNRAVGFLRARDNADMILGQIWEQLTSDHPEAFFAPEDGFDKALQTQVTQPEQKPPVDTDQDATDPPGN